MHPKGANGMPDSVDPDQTVPSANVCLGQHSVLQTYFLVMVYYS